MSLRKVTSQQLIEYVKALVPDNPEAENNTRTENIRNQILYLHDDIPEARMHKGTLFGLVNATSEYCDHNGDQKDPTKQLRSIWFGGSGEQLKQRAFKLAESML
jgi:hypothetical protein